MNTRREFLELLILGGIGAGCAPRRALGRKAPATMRRFHGAPEIVGRVTGRQAEINIVAEENRDFLIRWGEAEGSLARETRLRGRGSLTAKLKGLEPGRRYCYRVDKGNAAGAPRGFVTRRKAGQPFSFAVVADSHVLGAGLASSHYDNLRGAARMVAEEEVDFVLFVGDEVCLDGSGASEDSPRLTYDLDQVLSRYAFWRDIYAPMLACKPAYLALGNHDGEAGFYREEVRAGRVFNWQLWGTIARKQYLLNPRPDTYPEGGENEGWADETAPPDMSPGGVCNCSPLENYFAWSWGDALFVVLDTFRYTQARPAAPEEWTLGEPQLRWLERTLEQSRCNHKFVIAHHLVGGAPWNAATDGPGAYGRGGAEFADAGEQRIIQGLMERHGARFYLYGHDHIFSHSKRREVSYVCCGRPRLSATDWWETNGWSELYGNDFQALPGYTLVDVTPEKVTVRYKISGSGKWKKMKWEGRAYPLRAGNSVRVESPVREVIKVWSPEDPLEEDLFPGGAIGDREITLGRQPPGNIRAVNVVYVGQESFRREFDK